MRRVYSQHIIPGLSVSQTAKQFTYNNFISFTSGGFVLLTFFLYFLSVFYTWGLPTLPHDPNKLDLGHVFQSPTLVHWMGTDHLGRDIFSRLVMGTQAYTIPGILAVVAAVSLGVGLGAVRSEERRVGKEGRSRWSP